MRKNLKSEDHKGIYPCSFSFAGEDITVLALVDTGNHLYEPISHMPVSVIEKKVLFDKLNQPFTSMMEQHRIKGIRVIPYHTIGNENGVMIGIFVSNIKIKAKKKEWVQKKAVIGIVDYDFSNPYDYHMLLHPDLTKN